MALPRLTLSQRGTNAPDRDGYQAGDRGEVIATEVEGGLPRMRRDFVGGALPVSCKWTLTPTDYAAFETFYETTIAGGSLPFLVSLYVRGGTSVEQVAQIKPGSKSVVPLEAMFVVTCQIWAVDP